MALLSARSPKLTQALASANRDGLSHLILDGTLIYTDRVRADRPYYSGKHRAHGQQSRAPRQSHRGPTKLRDHPRMEKGSLFVLSDSGTGIRGAGHEGKIHYGPGAIGPNIGAFCPCPGKRGSGVSHLVRKGLFKKLI